MTITLYHTNDNPKTVDKTLTDASSEQYATLRDAVDILRPVLRIQRTVTLDQYNYVEIPAFGRYYFIESITVDRTGLSELQCVVDPLMSHKAELMTCPAIFDRSANADTSNVDLSDSLIRLEADRLTEYIDFTGGLHYPERIIMICNV